MSYLPLVIGLPAEPLEKSRPVYEHRTSLLEDMGVKHSQICHDYKQAATMR